MHYAWEQLPPLEFRRAEAMLRLLDQTLLPFEERFVELRDVDACIAAIRQMRVRGAPLIGLAGAAALAIAVRADADDEAIESACLKLLGSRPTAVNLRWALERVRDAALGAARSSRFEAAADCVELLRQAEFENCRLIGSHGMALLRDKTESVRRRINVLTHCNAGWLATGAWGTALAPVYMAAEQGIDLHVWVDETRPRNQGARLTAWELGRSGIAHTIIADNVGGHLMRRGMVDLCIVGSDRTTAHGDVCNKIGTYQKALAAADNEVDFHVALPVSTIDWALQSGTDIEIEQRDPDEQLFVDGVGEDGAMTRVRVAAPGSTALNCAFDVTPARLVSGLICEHGLFEASRAGLERLRSLQRIAI